MIEQGAADIRARLQNAAAPEELFSRLFVEAALSNDTDAVELLIEAAAPLLNDHPALRPWYAHAQGYLSIFKYQRAAEAIALLEPLWHQRENLEPALRGRVLHNLGLAYELNEQWDRALRCYQESVALCQAQGDDFGLGSALSNVALVYYKAQDYREGIACARRSIAIFDRHPEVREWQIYQGTAWNALGLMYFDLGQLQDARQAFDIALHIWTRWQDEEIGIAYHNLGDVHRRLGNVAEARQHYRRAYALLLEANDRRQAAEALYWLAVLDMHEQPAPAATLFDAPLALAHETDNYEIITKILLSRAELQEQLGNARAALEETHQAVAVAESLRANIVLPDDRARMTASQITAYEHLVTRLRGSPAGYAEAFFYAEMSKSRALVELLAGQPLHPPENVPPEWLERETSLRQSLDQLNQQPDADPAETVVLETELHRLRETIRLHDADFASFQTVNPLTVEQVQERLPPGALLLEYFTTGDTIIVFVVRPDTLDVLELPLKVQDLRRAFARLETEYLGPLHNILPAPDGHLHPPWILRALYQKLLAPVEKYLQDTSMLCIIPHGILHHIPFHTLYQQTPDGPRYLNGDAEQLRPIIYAPSATVLFDSCQNKPRSQYTACLALGVNNHTLTQAEAEAATVAALVGGRSLNGAEATRGALLAEGARHRYLHLSCHGRFNASWPTASTLSLADGTLDVTDVLRELRLNAELVTLSACETGYSHVLRGDELIGFIRAFLYAGTPAVLVSQWVVDELSTRLLMERFYQEVLQASQSPTPGATALALCRAQHYLRTLTLDELRTILLAQSMPPQVMRRHLSVLAAVSSYGALDDLHGHECLLAHPYYWAPFFLVGDRLVPDQAQIRPLGYIKSPYPPI